MNYRSVVLCAAAMIPVFGCQPAERDPAARTNGALEAASAFELVTIGGRPILSRAETPADCGDRPYYSRFVLNDDRWSSTDSTYAGCGATGASLGPIVRHDSGSFRIVADTLNLYTSDTTVGVRGLVLRGRLAADTLILWGTDYDGGDYLYTRRPGRDP